VHGNVDSSSRLLRHLVQLVNIQLARVVELTFSNASGESAPTRVLRGGRCAAGGLEPIWRTEVQVVPIVGLTSCVTSDSGRVAGKLQQPQDIKPTPL
jgi:hypothetical protein